MKKVMIGIGAFVGGVITGAAAMLVYKNIQIGKKSKLHEENYSKLEALGRSKANAIKLFEYVEQNPIIETKKTADALGLSYNTVATAIKNLCALDILVKSEGETRSKTFSYIAYLDILKKGTE